MLATTSILGAGMSYLRPITAYASCSADMNLTGSTTSAEVQQAIDDAILANCSTLTLTTNLEVDVVVNSTINLGDTGLDLVGAGSGVISFVPGEFFYNSLMELGEGAFEITNVRFADADTYGDGGAIYAGADWDGQNWFGASLVVNDVVFENNHADDMGGAIWIGYGSLVVNDSQFIDNTADSQGGAIAVDNWQYINAQIFGSTFTDNSAQEGGAIFVDYESYLLTVEGSEFTGNQARDDQYITMGGAISAADIGSIINSTFTNNSALNTEGFYSYNQAIGGAIEADNVEFITDSTFTENTSEGDGGAIEATDILLIESSTFTSNISQNSDGGAIEANDIRDIVSSTFSENSAGDDGGAIYASTIFQILDSTFTLNEAQHEGGAIYADDYDVDEGNNEFDDLAIDLIRNSTFTENSAGDDGGAIQTSYDIGTIEGSTFESNHSGDRGGAIETDDIDYVLDSIFSENTAEGDGGAIEAEDILLVSNSVFTSNTTDSDGGAIEADTIDDIVNSQFLQNSASDDGGAIESDIEEILFSTFAQNSTGFQGGAIDAEYINVITNSTFFNNESGLDGTDQDDQGRALFIWGTGNTTSIRNSTFWSSGEATGTGVAEVFTYSPLVVNSSVVANSAGEDSIVLYQGTDFEANFSFLSGVDSVAFADWGVENLEGSDPGLGTELVSSTDGTDHMPVLRPLPTSVLTDKGDPEFTGFGEGVPVTDQRGLPRVLNRIDIGAVELLASEIQEATPVVPVASNSIPTSVTLTPRTAAPGQSATISGPGTANILRVSVAGQSVAFTRQADGRISFAVPTGLKPGVYDVEMTLDLGQIITREKITISGAIKTRNLLYTNFVGDRSVLPSSARSGITAALAGFKNVTKVVCIGSTSGTTATAADRRLAQQRAQAACNLVKRIRPDVVVELRTRPASGIGARFRSVTIQIQGS